jgi:hypothetical protein
MRWTLRSIIGFGWAVLASAPVGVRVDFYSLPSYPKNGTETHHSTPDSWPGTLYLRDVALCLEERRRNQ